MQHPKLEAQKRDTLGKKVKHLRAEGILPANLYGKGINSTSLSLAIKDFIDVYKQVHETGVIDLTVEETVYPVLIKHVQKNTLDNEYIHADLFKVNLKQKTKATVPVVLTGEAPAVLEKIGILQQILSDIEVEALPDRLPDQVEINIEPLTEINQYLTLADVVAQDGVTIITSPTTVVVKISEMTAEEPEEVEVEADVEGIEEAQENETDTRNEDQPQDTTETTE